uniref:Bm14215, isoform b n=1 Tax=Brugia malayi TaxID=6279 RepID=A0A0J9XVH1_BRUMA|nr:Bm14215, isoform b [Brugia malayi]
MTMEATRWLGTVNSTIPLSVLFALVVQTSLLDVDQAFVQNEELDISERIRILIFGRNNLI